MTADQFWYDDPYLAVVYREANRLQTERKNQEMWWQGMYIHVAVSTAVSNLFRKKGQPPSEYIQKPVRVTPLTKAERKEAEERERKKAIDYFVRLEKMFNAKESKPSVPSAKSQVPT